MKVNAKSTIGLPSTYLCIKSYTWNKDSYGLFDYDEAKSKITSLNAAGSFHIYWNYVGGLEASLFPLVRKYLLHAVHWNDTYYISPSEINNDAEYYSGKAWNVIKDLKVNEYGFSGK